MYQIQTADVLNEQVAVEKDYAYLIPGLMSALVDLVLATGLVLGNASVDVFFVDGAQVFSVLDAAVPIKASDILVVMDCGDS